MYQPILLLTKTFVSLTFFVSSTFPAFTFDTQLINSFATNSNITNNKVIESGSVQASSNIIDLDFPKIVIKPTIEIHTQPVSLDVARLVQIKATIDETKRLAEEERLRIAAEEEARRLAIEAEQARVQSILGVTSGFGGDVLQAIKEVFGGNWYSAYLIANCESSLNPNAIGDKHLMYGNGYGASYGVFQIRYVEGRPNPEWLINVYNNLQYAYNLSNGGTNWSQWSCARKVGV